MVGGVGGGGYPQAGVSTPGRGDSGMTQFFDIVQRKLLTKVVLFKD